MNSSNFIEISRKLKNAENYEFLRSEGQKYIEKLGKSLWTDFNAHDPGITILEVLCYAITELGYRTNFSIEDLLTGENHKISNPTFFPCSEVMTNAPLTELDYRKLIIDIEGVNNAWFIYFSIDKDGIAAPLKNEVSIFLNKKEDKLSFSNLDKFGNTLKPLSLKGLARPIVELSDDIELGQLNEVSLDYTWSKDDRFIQVEVKSEIETWNDKKVNWLSLFSNPDNIIIHSIEEAQTSVKIIVENSSSSSEQIEFEVFPFDRSEITPTKNHLEEKTNLAFVISKLFQKSKKVKALYDTIDSKLNENRNLNEDWLCTNTITNIDIGICVDIEIKSETDAEETLANIYQALDTLFNPPIKFHTLDQMLEMDYQPRAIFQGPSLEHGFLIDEDVNNSQLPNCIHASDIIAEIMNVDGVENVKNLLMTAFNKNSEPIEDKSNQSWCITLNGKVRPVFKPRLSKFLLFRDDIPFVLTQSGEKELDRGIFYLKVDNNNYKLKNSSKDFPLPVGKHYRLDHYYSIQHDFPSVYGIGEGELAPNTTNLRLAQAKQLKAYLIHFDQLLADFFKQLHKAKDYWSTTPMSSSYAAELIESIPGVETEYFHEEIYKDTFENEITAAGYGKSHYESIETFQDRRNRFLDHLLARFGESFGDYVFMMYRMQFNAKGISELKLPVEDLISDKERFLNKVAQLSYSRGLGLDYCQQFSDSSILKEPSGFSRRIAALLGINQIPLQKIVDTDPKETWIFETETRALPFKLLNPPGLSLEEKWNLSFRLFSDIRNYQAVKFTNTFIYFVDANGVKIARFDDTFDSVLEAEEFIPTLFQLITSHLENFYCVEHILLRPFFEDGLKDSDLFSVCLNNDCVKTDSELFYANQDPYSFKSTLVFPGWLPRFGNRYFRTYAENLIRKEAPAQALIKICWVGKEDMMLFQQKFQIWLNAFGEMRKKHCFGKLSNLEKTEYNNQLSAMIQAMKALNSIFEKGTLHDCLESKLDNPIVLNNSSLGTL